MTPVQARKLVLVSMFLLGVIAIYRSKQGSESTFRRLWGLGVIGVVLSVAADFIPQIAGPFAGLVLLGSLTNGGDQAIQNLLGSVGSGRLATGGSQAGSSFVNTSPSTHVAVVPGPGGTTTVQHITGP